MAENNNNFKAKILTASAGSGKTFNLAYQYIYDVLKDQPTEKGAYPKYTAYRSILAVTFTNKATEEMKTRILKQLNNLAVGGDCEFTDKLLEQTGLSLEELIRRAQKVRSAILHDYSRFSILTNDTFFQRIVRAFVKELGGDLGYSIELDTAPIIQKSIDTLINQADNNSELKEWLLSFAEENINEGSQWNLKSSLNTLKAEIFKEQTKEAIEAVGDKQQLKKCVEQFTKIAEDECAPIIKIAKNAVKLIQDSKFNNSDFASSFTIFFDKVAQFKELPELTATIRKHTCDEPRKWFPSKSKPTADMLALAEQLQKPLADIVDNYDHLEYLFNSCKLLRENYRSFALLNDLYQIATDLCNEQNTMLLSQTKHTIAQLITSEDDAPFVYEKVGNRFEKFMIDEFQDTSLKEWKNFLPLLRNALSESADLAVLLVGDIKQSIYRWRGSDWNILRSIAPADLKENNTPVHIEPLDSNYRSLPEVVTFNNTTMEKVAISQNNYLNSLLQEALTKGIITERAYSSLYNAIEDAYTDLEQKSKKKHTNKGFIRVTAHYTPEPDIISCLRELIYEKGFLPCDITILVRYNDDAQKIAKVLLDAGAQDESMRFGIMTQEALILNSSPIIDFILATMRYAVNRRDKVSLGIYKRQRFNYDFITGISEDEERFFNFLASSTPEEAFEHIMMRFGDLFDGNEAYTQAFHEHIIKFCGSKVADLQLFLDWWDEKGGEKSVAIEKDQNAIEIMSIHKAKGLENKVVIIPYCTWSFIPKKFHTGTMWANSSNDEYLDSRLSFPIKSSKMAANSIFAEQYYKEFIYNHIDAVNILYVALTRPKEQLYIYFPVIKHKKEKKTYEEQIQERIPSTVGQLLYKIFEMYKQYTPNEDEQPAEGIIYQTEHSHEGPEEKEHSKESTIMLQPTRSSNYTLNLKFPSARYIEAQQDGKLSPQDKGIALHKVMEQATSREQITQSLEQMLIDGKLSAKECKDIEAKIDTALSDNIAHEWFYGQWDAVYTESGIIAPNNINKRPDRVMIKGKRVVVVDYKFGKPNQEHQKQISEYCQLLEQMGYQDISGYLWYVRRSKIEKIV